MSKKKYVAKSKSGESRAKNDLQRINGIGPAVEERLHKVGIATFAHLAALSPADIAAALMGIPSLTADAIKVQDWIGQAHKLALHPSHDVSQPSTVPTPDNEEDNPKPATTQYTALFTVEIALTKEHTVDHISALHLQSLNSALWDGWQAMPLLDFLVQKAEINLSNSVSTLEVTETPQTSSGREQDSKDTSTKTQEDYLLTTQISDPINVLQLRDIEILPQGIDRPRSILATNQPFNIRLTLDLTNFVLATDNLLHYDAVITAKRLEDQTRHIVGEGRGVADPAKSTTITMEGKTVAEGTYRLLAEVGVKTTYTTSAPGFYATARSKGATLLVY